MVLITSFTRGDWIFEKPSGGDTLNVSTGLNDTILVNGNNVSQNFLGLCIGDVNGSNIPSTGAKGCPKIEIEYSDFVSLGSNEFFEIPFIATEDLDIGAMSLILNYPKQLVTISSAKFSVNNENHELSYHIPKDEIKNCDGMRKTHH